MMFHPILRGVKSMFVQKVREFASLQEKYSDFGALNDATDYIFQDRLIRMMNKEDVTLPENWYLNDVLGSLIIAKVLTEKLVEIINCYDPSCDSFIKDYCWRIVS